jgi:hypothetical protein
VGSECLFGIHNNIGHAVEKLEKLNNFKSDIGIHSMQSLQIRMLKDKLEAINRCKKNIMNEYDFLVLSPHEFENLSRDILQQKESVFIESFTTGRDGGIDLRYAKSKSENVIIQAKRYKDFNSLYSNLKGEAIKVASMAPGHYILTTSVGLTPSNKDTIKELFKPNIKSTEDILGKDDLNNLLSQQRTIELKYYKLWLSSTNILDRVLHSKVYNQSAFELEEIRDKVKLYVQNESFNQALEILNNNRYVIISGIPGIGKSTLARILILYSLSNNFDEFIFLNQSIDDGYEFFKDGKRQVFLFDDFLGKNFFETRNIPQEDNKIVRFIEKIKRSPDKILILATREYILNQATVAFEAFKINNIEIAKCVLDLSSYTNLIKAQIIYNHLYFAEVPVGHLEDLIKENSKDWGGKKNYEQLISHKNYNPRIIQTIVERRIWEHCSAEQFTQVFKSYLDNPESVWLYAFENSLDKFSQYALIVLLCMGTPVRMGDWEIALVEFLTVNSHKYWISYDSIKFNRAIRELENTFIKTDKDTENTIIIEYQNPSIQDFLVNYLRNKKDLIKSVLQSNVFTDQFFSVFTTMPSVDTKNNRKILLEGDLIETMTDNLSANYIKLRGCTAVKHLYPLSKYSWRPPSDFKYKFLESVYIELAFKKEEVMSLVYEVFQGYIYLDESSYSEQRAYINLLKSLDRSKLVFEVDSLIDFHMNQLWIDNLELFSKIAEIFPEAYKKTIADKEFKERVKTIVIEELDAVDESDFEGLKSQMEEIESLYNISLSSELRDLERKEERYQEHLDEQIESYIEDRTREYEQVDDLSQETQIQEIFNSLASR